jgi:hypothetical protein
MRAFDLDDSDANPARRISPADHNLEDDQRAGLQIQDAGLLPPRGQAVQVQAAPGLQPRLARRGLEQPQGLRPVTGISSGG